MGSGTTGLACLKTGRNFVGVEISPEYYEVARRRLAEADGPMFPVPVEEGLPLMEAAS